MSTLQEQGTRLIIPAPTPTFEEPEVSWYEVRLLTMEDQARVVDRDPRRKVVASAIAQFTADHAVKTVLHPGEEDEVTITIEFEPVDSGARLRANINGQKADIAGEPDPVRSRARVSGRLELGAEELATMARWAHLAEPLRSLAQATRNSWGCGSCLLLGAGVAVGAGCCVAGNPGCCAGALGAGGTFLANCEGACAQQASAAVIEEQVFVE